MAFELPELPYAQDALAPHISAETLEFHWGKHHRTYVNKLNELIAGSDWEGKSLEEIIRGAGPGGVFNSAAQHWNHSFYWNCLSPQGGGEPSGAVADGINKAFGDFASFQKEFTAACLGQFGSGWAWLTVGAGGALAIEKTPNAETPLTGNTKPILTCDVWEHAYYVDYRNDRGKYVGAFWNLVNWDFVASQI